MRGLTRVLLGLGAGCLILALLTGIIGLCLGGRFGSFQPTPDGLRYLPSGLDADFQVMVDWAMPDGEDREMQTVALPADSFAGVTVDSGLAAVTVRAGTAWQLTTTHPELCEVTQEAGRLVIDSREPSILGQTVQDVRLTLEVPADAVLDRLELDSGLGSLTAEDLVTGSLNVDAGMSSVTLTGLTVRGDAQLDCGAGSLTVNGLTAETVRGECGLGNVELTGLTAGSLELSCGLGMLTGTDLTVAGDTVLDCGAGTMEVTGDLAGSLTADCGMGSLTVTTPQPEQYSLDGSCGLGSLTVDGRSVSGADGSLTIENDASIQYRLSVDMGALTVRFAD